MAPEKIFISKISNYMHTFTGDNNFILSLSRHSKDLNTLRCLERQMQKSADMIKTALNEVGCEELPSGCDDLSVDQNFIETNSPDQPVSLVNTNRFFYYYYVICIW